MTVLAERTTLAEPAVTTAVATRPAEPVSPAVLHPEQPAAPGRPVARSGGNRSADAGALATTEQLLRQRDQLPAGHPDHITLRARVIEANLPLAHHLARRYTGRGELLEDLTQVAALALIKAVDGYDPNRNAAFTSYAIPSILGALKRHFRDTAWGMRVPRSAQELAQDVVTATGELEQRRGRAPTSTELADHLRVTVDDLLAAVAAAQAYHLASLHAPRVGADGADLVDLIGGVDPRYADVDDYLSLRPMFAALPPRERRILALRFYADLNQTQIAAEIGLSQMHVSRLLRQSLARLRAAMPD